MAALGQKRTLMIYFYKELCRKFMKITLDSYFLLFLVIKRMKNIVSTIIVVTMLSGCVWFPRHEKMVITVKNIETGKLAVGMPIRTRYNHVGAMIFTRNYEGITNSNGKVILDIANWRSWAIYIGNTYFSFYEAFPVGGFINGRYPANFNGVEIPIDKIAYPNVKIEIKNYEPLH